jgi:hypothetical protein
MLDRERLFSAFPLQAMRRDVTPYLRLSHLIQRLDRDCRILGAISDEEDALTQPESPGNAAEDFQWVAKLVMDIGDNCRVGSGR